MTDQQITPQKSINSQSTNLKSASAYTISFSGYTWYVKTGTGAGPGPNNWNPQNVWVDADGKLHLTITYNTVTRKWDCAEVWTTTSLGFGKFEWFVDGRIDLLDKNVVLGLFTYPTSSVGPDGTNEIDIEYSHWGLAGSNIGDFGVYPAKYISNYVKWSSDFPVALNGSYTTQRFIWNTGSIKFQSLHGWVTDDTNEIFTNTFSQSRSRAKNYIPQKASPVHINLWLYQGNPPSDNSPVEVVIGKFQKY